MVSKALKASVFAIVSLALLLLGVATAGSAGAVGVARTAATSTTGGSSHAVLTASKCGGSPIKIMGIEDVTGPIPHPQEIDGVKAGVYVSNKACSAGRPISYTVCDDQGSANQAAACARQAVSGKYVAVVNESSPVSSASEPILQAGKIPIVGGLTTSSSDSTYPYGFMMIYPQDTVDGASKVLKAIGTKKIAFVAVDDPAVQFLVQESTTYAKSLGLTVLPPIYTSLTATDYAPYAAEAQSEGAQAVSLIEGEQQQNQFLTALHQRGVTESQMRVITTTQTFANPDIKQLGAAAEGVLLVGAAYPTDDSSAPGIQAYLNGLKAAGINDPIKGDYGFMAWNSVKILNPIFKKLGNKITPTTVFKALAASGLQNTPGFHPMNFSKKAFANSGDASLANLRIWSTYVLVSQIVDAKIEPVGGFQSVLQPFTVNLSKS